jgi:hypothetical protein
MMTICLFVFFVCYTDMYVCVCEGKNRAMISFLLIEKKLLIKNFSTVLTCILLSVKGYCTTSNEIALKKYFWMERKYGPKINGLLLLAKSYPLVISNDRFFFSVLQHTILISV